MANNSSDTGNGGKSDANSTAEQSAYKRDDYWQAEQEDRSADEVPETDRALAFQDEDEKVKKSSDSD